MIKINLLETAKGKNKRVGGSSAPSLPAMEMGDCSIPMPLAFSRPISSPCTRLATRFGFFAAFAACSN